MIETGLEFNTTEGYLRLQREAGRITLEADPGHPGLARAFDVIKALALQLEAGPDTVGPDFFAPKTAPAAQDITLTTPSGREVTVKPVKDTVIVEGLGEVSTEGMPVVSAEDRSRALAAAAELQAAVEAVEVVQDALKPEPKPEPTPEPTPEPKPDILSMFEDDVPAPAPKPVTKPKPEPEPAPASATSMWDYMDAPAPPKPEPKPEDAPDILSMFEDDGPKPKRAKLTRKKGKSAPFQAGDTYGSEGRLVLEVKMDDSQADTLGILYNLTLDNGDLAQTDAVGEETMYEVADDSALPDWMDPKDELPAVPDEAAIAQAQAGGPPKITWPDDQPTETTVQKPWTAAERLAEPAEDAPDASASLDGIEVPEDVRKSVKALKVFKWLVKEHPKAAADLDAVKRWAVANEAGITAFAKVKPDRIESRVESMIPALLQVQ